MNAPLPSRLLFLPLSLALTLGAHAEVRLPAVISDHMVLQQEKPASVWGWADPKEKISITFGGATAETVANEAGEWRVKLDGLKAGAAGDLVISGTNTITVSDVIVGEVWLASGQSNMEWKVPNALNAQEEIAAANFPQIRMFTVEKSPQLEPQKDLKGQWQVCSPETVSGFSAVGYYFARKIHQDLKAPVGVIHTSWGGTPAEYWTPAETLARDADFKPLFEKWEKSKADFPQRKEAHERAMVTWKERVEKAKAEGTKPPQKPREPRDDGFGAPGALYNGMIAPLTPYTIQGAIWYQGESNAGQAKLYRKLFPTMILSWRQQWGEEFPFLFVQLANFNASKPANPDKPHDSQWAELREAQLMTLELPHTAMAVAIDIGEANDIHPKNKQEVGRRLALAALATVYYQEVQFSGPIFTGAQVEEGKVRLSFRHAEDLKPSEGDTFKGFAIAGEDRKFVWAGVEVEGDHLVISSPDVPNPVAVRYAWGDNPAANLVNKAGLPASPFRTDDWPRAEAQKAP